MNELIDKLITEVTTTEVKHAHFTFTQDEKKYSVIVLKGDSIVCGLMLSNLAKIMEGLNAVMDENNRTVIGE